MYILSENYTTPAFTLVFWHLQTIAKVTLATDWYKQLLI